ncbi:MAG: ATP-binding cassette domain-containing protein [Desulfohalobiaceae bacterium]|nr:ATP-binding cassette domain-containing protein [Desulfohalobiaceae bacterium]
MREQAENNPPGGPSIHLSVKDMLVSYGGYVVLEGVSFQVREGEVFVVMGESGSGKSTLLKALVGLARPDSGEVLFRGEDFWGGSDSARKEILRRCGVLYQRGALWSSMTLSENVALPLELYTELSTRDIRDLVSLKLALVGLTGAEESYPAQLSGGMQKRAGLARAMALDPEILFLDEPSAGLDPVNAKLLDDLILELCDSLGTSMVVVTHELDSIYAIADDAILLDSKEKTAIARGKPRKLLQSSGDTRVRAFLTRGGERMESGL